MNKKLLIPLTTSFMVFAAASSAMFSNGKTEKAEAAIGYVIATNGCQSKSVPTKVCLKPVDEEYVRQYYSSLNNLSASERKGTNLLKNLKTILYEMNYYAYGGWSTNGVTTIYSITDRDWVNSPVSSITTGNYDSSTETITGINHTTEIQAIPYVHMLYVDYSIETTTKAKLNPTDQNPYFDKEHVWCQSRGFKADTPTGPAGTDLHHLIAGDHYVNSTIHSNYPYGFVATEASKSGHGDRDSTARNKRGSAVHTSSSDESNIVFEPQDSDKGDIARAIFYMAARYNNFANKTGVITNSEPYLTLANYATDSGNSVYSSDTEPVSMGILKDLLAWNKLDPVDEYEIHRNDLIYRNYQGNRNPFIDFPQWADYIWGTTDLDGNNYNSTPTGSANPASDVVYYTGSEDVSVTGVSLDKTSHSMDRFLTPTVTLTATVSPDNATNKEVTWSTSNSQIATVSDGVVTAKKEGTVTITATTVDGGFTASCQITISDTTPVVTSVTMSQSSATVDVNRVDQVQLSATVNGTNYPPASVTWSTSNGSIATVSNSGLVTGLSVGTATITATSTYDTTKSATCTVNVIDTSLLSDTLTRDDTGVTGNTYTAWSGVKKNTDAVYAGQSAGSYTSIQIRPGTTSGSSEHSGIISTTSGGYIKRVDIDWNSNNTSGRVVEIYGSNSAYTTPNELYENETKGTLLGTIVNGTSTYLEIEDNYSYVGVIPTKGAAYLNSITFGWQESQEYIAPESVSLNKESTSLKADATETLVATIYPLDASNKEVTWSSDNESVATVENGVVTAVGAGTATITVETKDGHFTDECVVSVLDNPKIKHGNYAYGVAYKMYLQTKGYFNGGTGDRDYFGATDPDYADGVDVFFETVNSKLMVYFMDGNTKKYIVAYLNGSYHNFGMFTSSELSSKTIFDWEVNENGYLVANCNGTYKTFGLKSGQSFTTFALNALADTVKFIEFEYTAESYAKDFLDKITCDSSGVNSPIYSSGFGWNDFKLIFLDLDSSQKTLLTNGTKSEEGDVIQRMLSKYEYMVWKYHYEDFLNRNVTLSTTNNLISNIGSYNNILLIIVAISSVSLCALFVLSYRKRRHN